MASPVPSNHQSFYKHYSCLSHICTHFLFPVETNEEAFSPKTDCNDPQSSSDKFLHTASFNTALNPEQ